MPARLLAVLNEIFLGITEFLDLSHLFLRDHNVSEIGSVSVLR
jgi:hypothetical protein